VVDSRTLAGKRTYGDPCGIARALDVIGERWALLVVRELLLGPKRFTDLRAGLPHVSPDVLSQRLRQLEDDGVVDRRTLPPPAASQVYELTARGQELEPVVLALGRWGSRAPFPDGYEPLGMDALVLALKTLYRPDGADGLTGSSFELRLGEQRFAASLQDGRLEVARGAATDPLATIDTDSGTLQRILWHGHPLTTEALTITGDQQAAVRFLTLFPLPE